MKIVKISSECPEKEIINHAFEILQASGILVIPTETAYGLAADATNEKAIKKIYKIKGRDFRKFLPLIGSSAGQVRKYFKASKREMELIKKEGISVVLKVKSRKLKVKKLFLLKNQNDCAVRVSPNKVCKLLARKLGRPITATSANRAGGGNCYSVEEVLEQLGKLKIKPDLVLDGGKLDKKKSSTVARVGDNKVKVLRQGEIKIN